MTLSYNGDNMCFDSMNQADENSLKMSQMKSKQLQQHNLMDHPSENLTNFPVYGHLVTADQLNQMEQKKKNNINDHIDSHGLKPPETTNIALSTSEYVNMPFQRASMDFCEVSPPKPHSIVPYYAYPSFDNSSIIQQNLKSHPQNSNNRFKNSALYENASHHFCHKTECNLPSTHPTTRIRPLLKVSVDLIVTYKLINENYYEKKKHKEVENEKRKRNLVLVDDERSKRDKKQISADQNVADSQDISGNMHECHLSHHVHKTCHHHHPHHHFNHQFKQPDFPLTKGVVAKNYEYTIRPGEVWKNRYHIGQLIGTGSFGQVVKAKDLVAQEDVAIKIIKNKRSFVEQAKTEIELLMEMGKFQITDEMAQEWGANYIVKLKNHFTHRDHLCLVFELLTFSLYDLLKNTAFKGVSLNLTRKFGKQICEALSFLSKSQVQIIHCDLKPENILLIHPRRSAIKVVDFGSSCRTNERIYCYIQSRFYRSPEVILNLDYNGAIDIWSLGCILVELHTGNPLFVGQFEHEQMLRIIEFMGMPPDRMLAKGKKTHKFFDVTNSQNDSNTYRPKVFRECDNRKIGFKGVSSRSLTDIVGVYSGGPLGRRLGENGHSPDDYLIFLDLIQKMLVLDPERRIKPDAALKHPFFLKYQSQSVKDNHNPPSSDPGSQCQNSNPRDESHPVEPTVKYLRYVGSSQDCTNITGLKETERSEL